MKKEYTSFEYRARYTEKEAREELANRGGAIYHLLYNDDGTFSIMFHIVCEHCDYCEEQGPVFDNAHTVMPVKAKPDPYINGKVYSAFRDLYKAVLSDDKYEIESAMSFSKSVMETLESIKEYYSSKKEEK